MSIDISDEEQAVIADSQRWHIARKDD